MAITVSTCVFWSLPSLRWQSTCFGNLSNCQIGHAMLDFVLALISTTTLHNNTLLCIPLASRSLYIGDSQLSTLLCSFFASVLDLYAACVL
ncbi:hypothetical protein BJ912DRAFT_984320 [Pholiota molesta]|nr:hypothetical protein BJ912DRAFT_984320 [Pholiota molesta]